MGVLSVMRESELATGSRQRMSIMYASPLDKSIPMLIFIEVGFSEVDGVLLKEVRSGDFRHRERQPGVLPILHGPGRGEPSIG